MEGRVPFNLVTTMPIISHHRMTVASHSCPSDPRSAGAGVDRGYNREIFLGDLREMDYFRSRDSFPAPVDRQELHRSQAARRDSATKLAAPALRRLRIACRRESSAPRGGKYNYGRRQIILDRSELSEKRMVVSRVFQFLALSILVGT